MTIVFYKSKTMINSILFKQIKSKATPGKPFNLQNSSIIE